MLVDEQQSGNLVEETKYSTADPFDGMSVVSATAEYTDCDCDCDSDPGDNY